MEHRQLEELGEHLRRLGHERREAVEAIVSRAGAGMNEVGPLYQRLDRISEEAVSLMEQQRSLIRERLVQ